MCNHTLQTNSVFPSDIKWAQFWQEQMNRNLACKDLQECANIWTSEEKAREFWKSACNNQVRYSPIIEKVASGHPCRILDIGGGPGTLALPLAELGCQVTVVEPAAGMITVLKENAADRGITGIHPVYKRWEEVNIQDLHSPYDAVVACYSLGMPDIAGAIQKMEQVCFGKIFLIWFAGTTPWENVIRDLWPVYHKRPFESGPKSDILFHVLYQMGIYPDVSVHREKNVEEHGQICDIVNDYAQRLCVPDRADRKPIDEYFNARKTGEEGKYRLPGELRTMIFSWESRRGS